MKREFSILVFLFLLSLFLINVNIRLDYVVFNKDYPLFFYGLLCEAVKKGKLLYYTLPYHFDSWDHIAIANEIIKKERIISYNPFLGENFYDMNWELNYHLFLVEIALLTGIKPLYLDVIIPTIIGFILALNVFILVRYLTKSDLAGIFSSIFVLTIKSNWTLLGLWFLVPVAYGMSMLPLFLLLFLKAINSERRISAWDIMLLIIFIQVTLSHPPSTIILIPIFLLYLILNPDLIQKNKEKIFIGIIVLLILLLRFVFIDNEFKFIYKIIRILTFSDEPYPTRFHYDTFLGYIAIIPALICICGVVKDKKMRILPVAFISLMPFILQYYLTGKLFLCPFRRLFIYTSEIALMMAGIGLFYLYDFITKFTKSGKIKIMVLLVIMIILFIQMDSSFYYRDKLPHIIHDDDINSIEYFKNTPKDSVVLTFSIYSRPIWLIGERRVISLERARLSADRRINMKANMFFNEDCKGKEKIINELNADYIFSKGKIKCEFLREVYSDEGNRNFIYKHEP